MLKVYGIGYRVEGAIMIGQQACSPGYLGLDVTSLYLSSQGNDKNKK